VKQAVRRVQWASCASSENTREWVPPSVHASKKSRVLFAGFLAGAGACLDTRTCCSSYDISTGKRPRSDNFAELSNLGLENVYGWHLNDSKIALGGKVDRHEHIGHGKIKAAALR